MDGFRKLFMVGLTMLLLSTVEVRADQERLLPGTTLPDLKGEFLSGRKAVLPHVAAGKIALLALGFTYDSRFAVEAWTDRFRKKFKGNAQVTFFEVPMIGGAAQLGRWFINRGMRKGTPTELHENVVTVYGGTSPWKERLAFKQENDAYLILLDPRGTVRWLHTGPFDEEAFAKLSEEARKQLGGRIQ